jgi:hypothetical protein
LVGKFPIYNLGNREQGTGNREQGTGNREQGTGNREQGTGNRKRVLGDFTFLHIPLNFYVHLLTVLFDSVDE